MDNQWQFSIPDWIALFSNTNAWTDNEESFKKRNCFNPIYFCSQKATKDHTRPFLNFDVSLDLINKSDPFNQTFTHYFSSMCSLCCFSARRSVSIRSTDSAAPWTKYDGSKFTLTIPFSRQKNNNWTMAKTPFRFHNRSVPLWLHLIPIKPLRMSP